MSNFVSFVFMNKDHKSQSSHSILRTSLILNQNTDAGLPERKIHRFANRLLNSVKKKSWFSNLKVLKQCLNTQFLNKILRKTILKTPLCVQECTLRASRLDYVLLFFAVLFCGPLSSVLDMAFLYHNVKYGTNLSVLK